MYFLARGDGRLYPPSVALVADRALVQSRSRMSLHIDQGIPDELLALRDYAVDIGEDPDWICGVVAALACVPCPVSCWPTELRWSNERAASIIRRGMTVLVVRGAEEDSVSLPISGDLAKLRHFCRGFVRGLRGVPGGHGLTRDCCEPLVAIAAGEVSHVAISELLMFVLESVQLVLQYAKGPPSGRRRSPATFTPQTPRTASERNAAKRKRQAR